MAFRDDLRALVAKLREAGRRRGESYAVFRGAAVADDGTLHWEAPWGERVADDHPLVVKYIEFMGWLDALASKLESYQDLDSRPLREIACRLGGLELGFRGINAAASTVFNSLTMAQDTIKDVGQMVVGSEWTGSAATAFYTEFVDPADDAFDLQRAYVQELNLAVGAMLHTVTAIENDVKAIAEATIAALDGDHGGDFSTLFGTVSTIATAAGFLLAPEVFGATSLGAGLISTFLSARKREPTKVEWTIETPQPNQVVKNGYSIVYSAYGAAMKLERNVTEDDVDIRDGLDRDLDAIVAYTDADDDPDRDFRVYRPLIADYSWALGTSTIPPGPAPGVPLEKDGLVVSLVKLYAAGHATLPAAAGYAEQAMEYIADCDLPVWLENYLPRTTARYNAARVYFRAALRQFASAARDSAAKLTVIALNYQLSDAESSERSRQIALLRQPVHGPIRPI